MEEKKENDLKSSNNLRGDIPTLRTLKSDAEKYIKEKNVSLINLLSKGARKKPKGFKEEKKFKIASIIGTLIIIVLLAAAFGLGYKIFLKPGSAPQKESPIPKPFIFSDEIQPIDFTGQDSPVSKIAENINKQYSYNSFVYLPILKNEQPIQTENLFQILQISPPAGLLKSLEKEFLLAVYADNNRLNNLVFAFKINSYEQTFRSMLEWEKNILEDLIPIFPSRFQTKKNALGTGTNGFYDKTLDNIDIRILESDDKKQFIVYGFFTNKFLIIANSEESFKAVIDRLKISLGK